MPSADLLGKHGTQRAMAARRYLQATAKQLPYLDKLLECLAPEVWGRLRRHQQNRFLAMGVCGDL
jgi:hypothetical protein